MYVLVDREQMAITHKHHVREVVAALAWIECINSAITVPMGNLRHWIDNFTPAELRKIYFNATGGELQGYGNLLAHVVHQIALRMPETQCNPEEVYAQRLKVMDGDPRTFQYCPGSMEPTCHKDLFTPDPIKCERMLAEEATAQQSRPQGATPSAGPANPFAPQVPTPPGSLRVPSAPRAGGVREIIFSTADRMWEAAGKPSQLKSILELRKQIMDVLESENNIKKTTSSTALGDWQKRLLS